MVSNILFIIISALAFKKVLLWDVNSDYQKWKDKIPVKHTKEWFDRALRLIPSFIFLYIPLVNSSLWSLVISFLVVFGVIFSVWWELFDGLYNRKRGFRWRFNGSIDSDDPFLDKFLYKIGDKKEAILKLGLISIFTILYLSCLLKLI